MKLVRLKSKVDLLSACFSARLLGVSFLLVSLASCDEDPMERYQEQFRLRSIDLTIEPASPIRLKIDEDMSPFYSDSPSGSGQRGSLSSTANQYTAGFGNLRSR
jgi:hypothetical protein